MPRTTSRWSLFPCARAEEVGERITALGRLGPAAARRRRGLRLRRVPAPRPAPSSSRAAPARSRDRVFVPYFAKSGEALAAPSTSSAGLHARERPAQAGVDDGRRDALLGEDRDRRFAGPELGEELLEVVELRRRIGRDARLQRLRVLRGERTERMLNPVAQLGQHVRGNVLRRLRDEEDADTLRTDEPDGLDDRVEEGVRRIGEEQMRLVEEEHELRLRDVADLRQLLEQLGEEPHEHGREQLRLVLHGGQLEARDDPAAVGVPTAGGRRCRAAARRRTPSLRRPRAATSLRSSTPIVADETPPIPLRSALPSSESKNDEECPQVREVEDREALLVRVAEDEREAAFLGLVRLEDLREQQRAEVRDRGAYRARPGRSHPGRGTRSGSPAAPTSVRARPPASPQGRRARPVGRSRRGRPSCRRPRPGLRRRRAARRAAGASASSRFRSLRRSGRAGWRSRAEGARRPP